MIDNISIVQFNPVVGDIEWNASRIIRTYKEKGATSSFVVFPECAVTGYPIQDLALDPLFVQRTQEQNKRIIDEVQASGLEAVLIFGSIEASKEQKPYNIAVIVDPENNDTFNYVKQELPIYGVFDESRTFSTNQFSPQIFLHKGRKIGIAICEDLWHKEVIQQLGICDFIFSINGSPFEIGKKKVRQSVINSRLNEINNVCPILYVNLVGGQDEIVFDGNSFLMGRDALVEFPAFREGVFDIKVDMQDAYLSDVPSFMYDTTPEGEVHQALVTSLRDVFSKQNMKTAIIASSGGFDSAYVSAVAADALGPKNVITVRLPSKYSSLHSLNDAELVSLNQGVEMRTYDIQKKVDSFSDLGFTGIAAENIQARVRGDIVTGISNMIPQSMVLGTSNKSECAMGYGTLYGDLVGGFNIMRDLYKSFAYKVAEWRNKLTTEDVRGFGFLGNGNVDVVPNNILVKEPSAELAEGQKDTDSLPEYTNLDNILYQIIELNQSIEEIVANTSVDEETVIKIWNKVKNSEYKRVQAVPGTKLTSRCFGKDRRYPFMNNWKGI